MAAYEVLLLNTAVPQIQAAQAGDTYVVPRDIAVNADLSVTGNTTLGNASTDTVRVNGYMGVGGAGTASFGVSVSSSALTNTSQRAFRAGITATSAATTSVIGYSSSLSTAAAAFTVADMAGFYAFDNVAGAGSTITNNHGLYIANQTAGTNNYGITSLVSSGTNKWNIYASGTAANYFAGNVGIGTATLVSNTNLTVAGSGSGSVTGGGVLSLFRTSTSVISSNNLGSIHFTGADTTSSSPTTLAYIRGQASGTHDPGDNPTDLVFGVTADGTETVYEAVRINQAGGIVTNPIAGGHTVFNEDGVDADFRVESDTNTHAFFVQGSDGFVGIGTSSPAAVSGGTVLEVSNATGSEVIVTRADTAVTAGDFIGGFAFKNTDTAGNPPHYAGFKAFATSEENGAMDLHFYVARIGYESNIASMVLNSSGNLSLGGSADRATTAGTAALNIFDATAPVGTLANGISIYSSSGEAYVMDAAGNATLFSPHDAETNKWIFKSKHTPSGKVLKIDVEKMLRFINDHFGLDAIHEFTEE